MPDFCAKKFNTQISIMITDSDNPLPIDWRFFIAIMVLTFIHSFIYFINLFQAASAFKCDYHIMMLTKQFLNYGGNDKWIKEGL